MYSLTSIFFIILLGGTFSIKDIITDLNFQPQDATAFVDCEYDSGKKIYL